MSKKNVSLRYRRGILGFRLSAACPRNPEIQFPREIPGFRGQAAESRRMRLSIYIKRIQKNCILFVSSFIFMSMLHAAETILNDSLYMIKTVKGTDDNGHFNLQYPVLTAGMKLKNRDKINAILKQEFLDDKLCAKDPEKKASMQSNSSIQIKFISQQIISIVTQYDTYCGGPYPDQGKLYATYNLSFGDKIELLSQVKDPSVFKSFLAKQFRNHIPQKIPQDCHDLYSTQELLQVDPQFVLAADKLLMRANYPHAARVCEFDITISRRTMNQFLKSDSVLY